VTADPITWPVWVLLVIIAVLALALAVHVPERIADWLFPQDRRG